MNSTDNRTHRSRSWRAVGVTLLAVLGIAIAIARFAYSVMAYAGDDVAAAHVIRAQPPAAHPQPRGY